MIKTDNRIDGVKLDRVDNYIEQMSYIDSVQLSFELYTDCIKLNMTEYSTDKLDIECKESTLTVSLYDQTEQDIKQTIAISVYDTADILYDSDYKRVIITAGNDTVELYIAYALDSKDSDQLARMKAITKECFNITD